MHIKWFSYQMPDSIRAIFQRYSSLLFSCKIPPLFWLYLDLIKNIRKRRCRFEVHKDAILWLLLLLLLLLKPHTSAETHTNTWSVWRPLRERSEGRVTLNDAEPIRHEANLFVTHYIIPHRTFFHYWCINIRHLFVRVYACALYIPIKRVKDDLPK